MQIVHEQFLVYINDLLSTGLVPDLFTPEDRDGFCNAVRNEVKAAGQLDTPDACWEFFINKVRARCGHAGLPRQLHCSAQQQVPHHAAARRALSIAAHARTRMQMALWRRARLQVRANLHVVLCFSPVGDSFRRRARQFPALFSATQLDWFHGWPAEALLSVARRFLSDIPDVEPGLRDAMAEYMAAAHQVRLAAWPAGAACRDRCWCIALPLLLPCCAHGCAHG